MNDKNNVGKQPKIFSFEISNLPTIIIPVQEFVCVTSEVPSSFTFGLNFFPWLTKHSDRGTTLTTSRRFNMHATAEFGIVTSLERGIHFGSRTRFTIEGVRTGRF